MFLRKKYVALKKNMKEMRLYFILQKFVSLYYLQYMILFFFK